jgi:hypothetical protein
MKRHIYIYSHIYIHMCVCVCVCVCRSYLNTVRLHYEYVWFKLFTEMITEHNAEFLCSNRWYEF